jgi:hypothetical protein
MTNIFNFLRENKTITVIVLANVVTYNLLNAIIEEVIVPLTNYIIPEEKLKKYDIIVREATVDKDEIKIKISVVVKKIFFWFIFLTIISLFTTKF